MDENTSQNIVETPIVAPEVVAENVDTPVTVEDLAGVPAGTELTSHSIEHGTTTEIVVEDLDDQGNVIGWHKELA